MSNTVGPFSGIFPYLVSPLDGDRVDESALRRLVGHLIDAGADGLCPLGSTGEVMYLSADQRERIVRITIDEAAGRVPVIPGVAAFATSDAVAQTEAMTAWGVDGIIAIQQVYGLTSVASATSYFSAIAAATPLPIVLYTNPRLGADLPVEALEQLVASDNIRYLKDASGVTGKLLTIQSRMGDRLQFFAASAHIPTAVFDLGGVGWMAGPACVVPEAAVALWRAHCAHDLDTRDRLQRALWPLNALFTRYGLAPFIKAALSAVGYPVGDPIAPQTPVPAQALVELETVLATIRHVMEAPDTSV